MPKINVKTPFLFSPDGKSVVDVEAGEQEVSERCAEVAVEHLKVATLVGDSRKAKTGGKGKDAEQPPTADTKDE